MATRTKRPARRAEPTRRWPRLGAATGGPAQREALGALLIAVAVVTVLAFASGGGVFTGRWLDALRRLLGWLAVAAPLVLGGIGAWLILDAMDGHAEVEWPRPAAAVLLLAASSGLLHLLVDAVDAEASLRTLAESQRAGGWLGYVVASFLGSGFGRVPAGALLILAAAGCATVVAGKTLREGAAYLQAGTVELAADARRLLQTALTRRAADGRQHAGFGGDEVPGMVDAPAGSNAAHPTVGAAAGTASAARASAPTAAAGPTRRAPASGNAAASRPVRAVHSPPWRLPAISEVLEPAQVREVRPDGAEALGHTIEQTLAEFGVPARVVRIERGPRVTQFGLEPGYVDRAGRRSKVKVASIVSLRNDLELALSVSPIRMLAPVPGRPYVGVEVPNSARCDVYLSEVLESEAFRATAGKGGLPIALGRDTSGRPVAADLCSMPHLLVAGTTGAGKSVAMNALICALLMTHTPETLKLLLVDPKRVEMVRYRGLPHLAAPVVVDIERIVGVLQWLVQEMDRRYKVFAEASARNLEGYNRAMRQQGRPVLPYLVVCVDELADVMMIAPDEAERLITRLAQLARATGIHLVLATQRPSVDVVTGLIKANFPSRIAFAVSSGVDSRVILDTVGAEKLLGTGDMLYQASDSSRLQRLQGCYVRDSEMERLCRFWRWSGHDQGPKADTHLTLGLPEPLIQQELWDAMVGPSRGRAVEKDPLYAEAVNLIRDHRTASTSFLQRRLRIGYSRAARLLDELEEAGIVGPAQGGSTPREVRLGVGDEAGPVRDTAARTPATAGSDNGRGSDDAPTSPGHDWPGDWQDLPDTWPGDEADDPSDEEGERS